MRCCIYRTMIGAAAGSFLGGEAIQSCKKGKIALCGIT